MAVLLGSLHPLPMSALLAVVMFITAALVYKYAHVISTWSIGDPISYPQKYRVFVYRFVLAPGLVLFGLVLLYNAIQALRSQ